MQEARHQVYRHRSLCLREIWMQPNKQVAEKVMLDWVKQAQEGKVPQLMKMAVTIMAYNDCPISTGKVKGSTIR